MRHRRPVPLRRERPYFLIQHHNGKFGEFNAIAAVFFNDGTSGWKERINALQRSLLG